MPSKILPIILIIALFLISCQAGDNTEAISQAVQQTVQAMPTPVPITRIETITNEVTRQVEIEVEVTRQVEVEVTRLVEYIITATPIPTPTTPPIENNPNVFALNNLTEVENGGLTVKIERVLIANKADLPNPSQFDDSLFASDTVGEIILSVTNNTQETIRVYPDQGSIQVNSEQIELLDYIFADGDFGDDLGGEIFAGVTKVGGFWFSIARSTPPEITQIIFRFDGPFSDDLDRLGSDFEIVIDLTNHIFQPLPDELKNLLTP